MGWFYIWMMAAALAGLWGVVIEGDRPFGYVVAVFTSVAFLAFVRHATKNMRDQ